MVSARSTLIYVHHLGSRRQSSASLDNPRMLCLCELTLNCILQLLFSLFGSDVCVCCARVLNCQSSTLLSSVWYAMLVLSL